MMTSSRRKNSNLTSNILFAAAQTLIQTIVLIVLYRYLLDSIGVEKLGVWAVVLATASAARISELGLAGSVTKFVATYRAQDNEKAAVQVLETAVISIALALGVILALLYPVLLWALPYVLPESGVKDGIAILPYAMGSLWFMALASILMGGLDGCLRSDLRAWIMVFGSLSFLFFSLLSVDLYGLIGLAIAQVVQGVILMIVGWLVVRSVMGIKSYFPLIWSIARFREMFNYGVNFQVNSVVMLLFEPVTKILLGRYGELAAAGYFEMAQRLVMKVRGLIVESNRVIVPVFAGMGVEKDDVRKLYVQNFQFLFFVVTPVFAMFLALTPIISELWIGYHESQFIIMTVSLALAWYLNSMTAPPYFAYLGQGKLRWITIAHIIMGSCNILVGVVLGKIFGWQGVIFAFILSLTIGGFIPVLSYHYEHRHSVYKILSMQDLVLLVVAFGGSATALICYWLEIGFHINIWVRAVIVLVGMVSLLLLATWFHPIRRQIIVMIKQRLH